MIQPSQVLPSNAPHLLEGNSVQHASRVLQEHSGNRQHTNFAPVGDFDYKYPTHLLTENLWASYAANIPPQQVYQPQARRRHALLYTQQHTDEIRSWEQEQKVQKTADLLYRRFRSAPQYKKYRQRQSKDDKGAQPQDKKWPDHLEEAFFYALVAHPPMGRHKKTVESKLRGRNELIAYTIQGLTGEKRDRKQVSSHIQVLKPFVEDDPFIMKWLSKGDMPDSTPVHMNGRRRLSMYRASGPAYATRAAALTAPQPDLVRIAKIKDNLDVFQPSSFSMFVQRKFKSEDGSEHEECLHRYTQSIAHPLGPDLLVPDWLTLGRDYTHLAAVHANRPLNCNVIVADASLGLTPESFREIEGVELGISLICSSRHLPPESIMKCHNSFYKNGICQQDYSASFDAKLSERDVKGYVTASVKFGSAFWAKTLAQLATRLRDNDGKESLQHDDVQASIRAITLVQEFGVGSEHGFEKLLVMAWTFRQSSAITGRTSWRRLILPPQEVMSSYTEVLPEKDTTTPLLGYQAQLAELHALQAQTQPTLQSPFEYDDGSASALSSATWPTSMSDSGRISQPHIDDSSFATDNDFDFDSGSINMAFDPSLDLCNFDSSAFDFDVTNTTDFAADPALDQYSQQWCDEYANSFTSQEPLSGVCADTNFAAQVDGQTQTFAGLNPAAAPFDPQVYGMAGEQQAYGGAGQDGIKQEEDPLTALADASFLAQDMNVAQGPN